MSVATVTDDRSRPLRDAPADADAGPDEAIPTSSRPPADDFRAPRAPRVAVIVAVVAMAAAVDPWGLRSFTTLRWALVSTAVAAAVMWCRGRHLPRSIVAAWAVVVTSMAVGAATGVDPVTAWLGHPQRHLGVLAWVVFAAATIVGAQVAGDRLFLRWLPVAATLAGAVVGGTALIDAAGWDPLGTSFAHGRVGGLFGQPIVLATVSLLLLPMVLAHRGAGLARWPIAGSLVAAIVVSQSRGAVLGLVIWAIVAAPRWAGPLRTRSGAATAGIGGVVMIIAVVFTPFGERLQGLPDSSRIDEWAVAARVVMANPVTGVGPEGYRIAVLAELDHDYVDAYGRDVVIDRAHSAPLDVTIAGGGLAAAGYLVLIGGAVAATWRLHRRDRTGIAPAAGAGAVAVFGAGLVAFPVAEVDAVAWLFAGLAIGTAARGVTPRSTRGGSLRRRAPMVLGGALFAVALTAGTTDVVVDHQLHDALAASRSGQHERARSAAEAAVSLRGDQVDSFYVAATVSAAGPTILDLDAGIGWTERGLDRFPYDPALADLHAELLVERAIRSELDVDVEAAISALQRLSDHDPTSLVTQSGTDALIRACLYRCDNKP